jgi:hypothetical protein
MKNVVFLDVMPCGSCENLCFGGIPHSMLQLLVAVNVVPSSLIRFALIMEATRSSESFVLTTVTRCHIPEVGILYFKNSVLDPSPFAQWTKGVRGKERESGSVDRQIHAIRMLKPILPSHGPGIDSASDIYIFFYYLSANLQST